MDTHYNIHARARRRVYGDGERETGREKDWKRKEQGREIEWRRETETERRRRES